MVGAQTAVTRTLTVGNTGDAPLVITGIVPEAYEISVSPRSLTIAPGDTASVNVTFAPMDGYDRVGPSSSIRLWSNDAAQNPYVVPVAAEVAFLEQPIISVTPSALDFGVVTVGTSVTRTLTVTGGSPVGPLVVTDAGLCAGTTSGFTVSPTTLSVWWDETATVDVTWTPTEAGGVAWPSCVWLESYAVHSPYVVPFTGIAVPPPVPAMSVHPSALDFGTLTAGTSVNRTLTVSNAGNAPLSVSKIELCPGTTGGFTVAPGALAVAPGGVGVVNVTFAPAAAGAVAAGSCLSLTSNDPTQATYTVPLAGAVTPALPVISAAPNPLDFGYQARWAGAKSLTLTVANTGPGTLSVTRVARCSGTSSEFSVSSASGFSVPPGGSRALSVSYDPEDAGADTGCLELASNDATQSPYRVSVTGTSVQPRVPVIATSPSSLAFGTVDVGSSRSLAVTVSNRGTATLDVSGVARCSGTSDEFRVWTSGFELHPGSSRSLTVTYRPSSAGTDSGCVAISSDDPVRGRLEIPVSATGASGGR